MDEAAVKALKDELAALKTQVTELATAKQQLTETSEYINDTSILVNAIMKDPDLAARVQASINGGKPATPPTPPTPPAGDEKKDWKFDPKTGKPINEPTPPPPDERIASLDGQKRQEIIDRVEGKFKIKTEETKEIRPKVGAWLRSYNMDITKIPVDQLEQKLSDAYLNIGLQSAKETGSTDAVIESYFEDPGKLPGMGSGSPENSPTTLNSTQKKWAGKLNVPEDKVAAGLKELTETGVITYKPKDEKQAAQATPSGTPTPPNPASN